MPFLGKEMLRMIRRCAFKWGVLSVALIVGLQIGAQARAVPIGISDFSGSESVETYSTGYPAGTNGATPYTINGITYQTLGSGGGASGMFLATTSVHADIFANIPGTSGAPVYSDNWTLTSLRISFSEPVRRVGLLLGTGVITTYRMSAFTNSDQLIDDVTVTMPAEWQAVFAGLELSEDLGYMMIDEIGADNGEVTFFDDLRFEAIPEPSTGLLVALGLLGMAARQRRLRR
jgi:hypothetical protein